MKENTQTVPISLKELFSYVLCLLLKSARIMQETRISPCHRWARLILRGEDFFLCLMKSINDFLSYGRIGVYFVQGRHFIGTPGSLGVVAPYAHLWIQPFTYQTSFWHPQSQVKHVLVVTICKKIGQERKRKTFLIQSLEVGDSISQRPDIHAINCGHYYILV